MELILLLAQVAATWFMTGLIWFVQIVHYPLYDRVGTDSFVVYERDHCALTTMIVAPVMVTELFTAFAMIVARPRPIGAFEACVGLALLIIIWLSTLFIADSFHGGLSSGFNNQAYHGLLNWNMLRVVLWTMRGLLMLWFCFRCMRVEN